MQNPARRPQTARPKEERREPAPPTGDQLWEMLLLGLYRVGQNRPDVLRRHGVAVFQTWRQLGFFAEKFRTTIATNLRLVMLAMERGEIVRIKGRVKDAVLADLTVSTNKVLTIVTPQALFNGANITGAGKYAYLLVLTAAGEEYVRQVIEPLYPTVTEEAWNAAWNRVRRQNATIHAGEGKS